MVASFLLGGASTIPSTACRYRYELIEAPDNDETKGGSAGSSSRAGSAGDNFVAVGGDAEGGSDAIDPGGRANGTGGSNAAASSGTGGTLGEGGSGDIGPNGDLIVTTNIDEDDAGATVLAPGATGLSLREAITIANSVAGRQIIVFESGIVVAAKSPLPAIIDPIQIIGGELNCAGVGADLSCVTLAAGSSLIDGLQAYESTGPVISVTGGSNSRITNCNFHDVKSLEISGAAGFGNIIGPNNVFQTTQSAGVANYAPGAEIVDNVISDSGDTAVFLSGAADGTLIAGNLLLRSGSAISMSSGTANVRIWHNTIIYNSIAAAFAGQVIGVDLQNNIIAYNDALDALDGASVKFAQYDYNLIYGNGASNCTPCKPGANSVLADPMFINAGAEDFGLDVSSPARNAGVDLGVDRNGAGLNNFNGSAPDLGYLESQ